MTFPVINFLGDEIPRKISLAISLQTNISLFERSDIRSDDVWPCFIVLQMRDVHSWKEVLKEFRDTADNDRSVKTAILIHEI